MTKKILIINGASALYGKERIALAITKGLIEQGYVIHTATNAWNDGKYVQKLKEMETPFSEFFLGWYYLSNFRWSLDSLIHFPRAYYKYYRLLKTFKPDVILAFSFREIFLLQNLIKNTPILLGIHDDIYRKSDKFVLKKVGSFVSVYISCSEFIAKRLRMMNIVDKNKIKTIYNGIEFNKGDSFSVNITEVEEYITFGVVGQISEHKGHMVLIDAINELSVKGNNFVLKIYGEGDLYFVNKLKEKINAYRLEEKVQWKGYFDNKDDIYANLSFVVVPSICDEAFGLVAVEPALYNKPVIASDSGGLSEIVLHGKTGLKFKSGDYIDLAKQIMYYLDSPSKIKIHGRNANEAYSKKFNFQKMCSSYMLEIERICKKSI